MESMVDKIESRNKAVQTSNRADRLISFLNEYLELWYNNGCSFEEKVGRIAKSEEEKDYIIDMYNQAENDYSVLRTIRSRINDLKQNNMASTYNLTDEKLDAIRQAGVGRAFGLSDENQAEYDRLVNAGVDEDVVRFIFKTFSNYQRFKEAFCDALKHGKEKELFKKCPKLLSLCVSDIDLSVKDGVRKSDRGYIDLIKDIFNVDYIIIDGSNLVETVEFFIESDDYGKAKSLNDNQKNVIRKFYGLGTDRMSGEEICKEMGISYARVRQIINSSIAKLSLMKSQLFDIVYLHDQSETISFLCDYYFKKNDIFITNKSNDDQQISDLVEPQDDLLSVDLYCKKLSNNLKAQISDINCDLDLITDKYKRYYDGLLFNFEKIKFDGFILGDMPLEKFGLSYRTSNALTKKGICTIGDIISFSRKCRYAMQLKISGMGSKSYDELNEFLTMLGLKLEDEDKSDKTKISNESTLKSLNIIDSAKFNVYLDQIRFDAKNSILSQNQKNEIELSINDIKEKYGIGISNEALSNVIHSRIDSLALQPDKNIQIKSLNVPSDVYRAFKLIGIDKISDLYRLKERDSIYIKDNYASYLDMLAFELKRMGLDYPSENKNINNIFKGATYFNKENVEFIEFLINDSKLDDADKFNLRRELLDKIDEIKEVDYQDVDSVLADKIGQLRAAYQMLDGKKQELHEIESCVDKNELNCDAHNFGDIG